MPVYYKGIIVIIYVFESNSVFSGRAAALASPGGTVWAGSAVARATFRLSTDECGRSTNLKNFFNPLKFFSV
jgi:hypothetical protein